MTRIKQSGTWPDNRMSATEWNQFALSAATEQFERLASIKGEDNLHVVEGRRAIKRGDAHALAIAVRALT
jgi:hypothetical protein